MKLKYLGTAAAEGWPGIFCKCEYCLAAKKLGGMNIRTRSQAVLDDHLLFDLPPDTYLHMVRDGLNMPRITHILITHTHQDHFYPEELLFRCGAFAHEVSEPLTIYGNATAIGKLEDFKRRYPYRDIERLDERLQWRELSPFQQEKIGSYQVTPLPARHDDKETCFIYLVEAEKKQLLYANDTGFFPEETWQYLNGTRLNLVSLDCTMGRYSEGNNHLGIPDVIKIKEQLLNLKIADQKTRFIATHFSHNGHLLHDDLIQSLNPFGIMTAYDGLEVIL